MKLTFNEAYDLLTKGKALDKRVEKAIKTKSGDKVLIFSVLDSSKRYILVCNLNEGVYKSYDFVLDCMQV